MSLLLTFMDLDKLYESPDNGKWLSRGTLISNIKKSGRYYNFANYPTERLYRIWERIQKEDNLNAAEQEYLELQKSEQPLLCITCGMQLTDGGLCPVCDIGEEDY